MKAVRSPSLLCRAAERLRAPAHDVMLSLPRDLGWYDGEVRHRQVSNVRISCIDPIDVLDGGRRRAVVVYIHAGTILHDQSQLRHVG